MAVEVDVEVRAPLQGETLAAEIANTLSHWLGLVSNPIVQSQIQAGAYAPDYPVIRFWINETAEVIVTPYRFEHAESVRACISYAPLRTRESKILCLATAIVLAKSNGVLIEDDELLFGNKVFINPNHALNDLQARKSNCDFKSRASEAFQLIETRRKEP